MSGARVFAVTVAALAGSACTGEGGDTADPFSVAASLAEIPAVVAPRAGAEAVLVDLEELAEAVGVEREPGVDVDADPMSPWASVLAFGTPDRTEPRRVVLPLGALMSTVLADADAGAELGWGFPDVRSYVSARSGDVTVDVAALDADRMPPDDAADADGVIRLGSGEDGTFDIVNRTKLRPLGEPLRIAVDDDRGMVAVSGSTPAVLAWAGGPGASWADHPDLALVAELLDEDERVYAAAVWLLAPGSPDPVTLQELTASPRAFGVAFSGSGDDQRTTWAYVFADDPDATVAGPEIRTILDGAAAEGTADWQAARVDEVTVEGRAVIARGVSASR